MRRFFFYLFILLPFLSNAQSNFKPGYLITKTGDSIPGFIDYKEREQNPSSFIFKAGEHASPQTYRVSDAKAYGVNGLERHECYLVDISQSKEDLALLSYDLDTTSLRDTVFLQVMQAGKNVTLYSYIDKIKTRFYIKEQASAEPYELIYSIYKVSDSEKIKDYNKYLRQLNYLMLKNNILTVANQEKLKRLSYDKASMLSIVSMLNDKQVEKSQRTTRFFVGAGLNSSKATYTGTSVFNGPGVTAKRSYSPMITAGVDFFANPHIGRLIFRAELSFLTSKSNINVTKPDPTIDNINHSFDSYDIILTPQIIWNVFNSEPLKVFFGGGPAANYSINKNNILTTTLRFTAARRIEQDRVQLNKFYFAPQANAGVVLHKRTEFFVTYMPKAPITDYLNYSVSMARINVGIKYLFGQ